MPARCFRVKVEDNVATLLDDVEPGMVTVLGAGGGQIEATEAIRLGHKLALVPLGAGATIVKYGEIIGVATRAIHTGEWVHLHNVKSRFDERSQTLDVNTGAVTDTTYE